MKIIRALISVSDKTGLEKFARALHEMEVEILSTGGTAKAIANLGIPVIEITDYTKYPECFGGRVKTLHPRIHGGLLYQRENPEHIAKAAKLDIPPINLVVVNLYPFAKTVAQREVTIEEAIEKIDIGGPALLRSAAKNYKHVTVICDPSNYQVIIETMQSNEGETTIGQRKHLAREVFLYTSQYDKDIADFMRLSGFDMFHH